jgi:hypothetical protein
MGCRGITCHRSQLVLDDDGNQPFVVAAARLFAWYMHVEEPVRKFKLLERHELEGRRPRR